LWRVLFACLFEFCLINRWLDAIQKMKVLQS